MLKEKYKNEPKITIYDKNACHIKDIFEKNSVDFVLSSLPLAFIDRNIVCEILSKSKFILKPE
jgi:phospholipid N-methyltransferase